MKPGSYINARGEQVVSFAVFRSMSPNAVARSLLPARPHLRRRDRRVANGTIRTD